MAIGNPVVLGTATVSGAGQTSLAFLTSTSVPAGSLITVSYAGLSGVSLSTVSSVSDTGINVYTTAAISGGALSDKIDVELWYAANANIVPTNTTMTVNFTISTGAGFGALISATYVSGIATSLPKDQTATGSVTSSSPSVTTGALAQASEIAIGAAMAGGSVTVTEASGFTNLVNTVSNTYQCVLDYSITSTTAAVTYNPQWNTSQQSGIVVATFKGSATAAGGFIFDLANPLR
jgi:hypothetical protein